MNMAALFLQHFGVFWDCDYAVVSGSMSVTVTSSFDLALCVVTDSLAGAMSPTAA